MNNSTLDDMFKIDAFILKLFHSQRCFNIIYKMCFFFLQLFSNPGYGHTLVSWASSASEQFLLY